MSETTTAIESLYDYCPAEDVQLFGPDNIPVIHPIMRRTITPEEALRDRCAELETVIRMAIRAFEGDLAPAIAEAACRDALL